MWGPKYNIKLAKPGELSGDLIIVGSVLEQTIENSDTRNLAVIHAVMGDENCPVSMENLRIAIKTPYKSKLVRKEYGDKDSKLITPGFFFKGEGYDPAEFFKGADIVYVQKKPVIHAKVPLEDVDIQKAGAHYAIPCYMARIFDMYERDFKKGKMSNKMMWHVNTPEGFIFYRYLTRKKEKTNKWIRWFNKIGWSTAGLESQEQELRNRFE